MRSFFSDVLEWQFDHQIWFSRLTNTSIIDIYKMNAIDFEAYLTKLSIQLKEEQKDDSSGEK